MAHYLLSVHTTTDEPPTPMSDDDMRRYADQIGELEAEMKLAGALLFSARLDSPATAAVVRSTNGTIHMTDGPFLESKESIGGFYVVEAPDREAALEWAAKTSAVVGMPIEVRPFFGFRAETPAS